MNSGNSQNILRVVNSKIEQRKKIPDTHSKNSLMPDTTISEEKVKISKKSENENHSHIIKEKPKRMITPKVSRKKDITNNNPCKNINVSNNKSNTQNSGDTYPKDNKSDLDSSSIDKESMNQNILEPVSIHKKNIEVRKIQTNEKIDLNIICKYLLLKDYKVLSKYKFPYMSQNDFNSYIGNIDLKLLRKLYFACPICGKCYRHFSMSFHIFQSHFEKIEEYLSNKVIARCCAKLMKSEYKKIKNSLQTFSELSAIFKNCQYSGNSLWRSNAENEIDNLEKLNIQKMIMEISKDKAMHLLGQKFPLNKSKRYKK